jgi:dipeptide/tripeptide permease
MQNTRLNSLLDALLDRLTRWLRNPWRRLSLLVMSLLVGNFLATAFSTIAGQQADWDIAVALVLVGMTEAISWLTYGSGVGKAQPDGLRQRPLIVDIFNGLKLGLIYGLFIEAFKLGS